MRNFTLRIFAVALMAVLGLCGLQAQTHKWKFVATGDGTTYAIDNDGSLWAWGWNESGQMGTNSAATKVSTPTQVGTDTNWKFATGGQAYAFFIKEDGTLWAVGTNDNGVSGVGDGASTHKVPTQVGTDANWKSVTCSRFFGNSALAIKTDGTLWAWGDGRSGQLGIGKYSSPSTPTQVGTDTDWAQASLGDEFALLLKTDGTIWGMGKNSNKTLLTTGSYKKSPVQVGTDNDWAKVFAVVETAYGIKKDGTIYVWGSNSDNKAGINDEDVTKITAATKIAGIEGTVIDVTGSDYNRYVAVGEDGVITKIYSWGSNADGALGDGSGVAADATDGIETITTPVTVALPEGVTFTQLASGVGHCVGLTPDGKIYGWGKNRGGQLGNYVSEDQMTFVAIPFECAVEATAQENVYTVDADDIPAQLSDAKKLILTGTWNNAKFQTLTGAIGNNTGWPPAGNSTIEEIDMSKAKIEEGTSVYVAYGMSSYGVFRGLKALTTVTMPAAEEAAHFTSLRSFFQNCTNLKSIDLSGCTNVTNLTDAFFGCAALTTVDLSAMNKVTNCESAFDQCTSLASVKLPATITLSKYTFGDNQSLKSIDWSMYAGTSVPKFPDYLFQYVEDLSTINLFVPTAMVDAFKADANWGQLNVVGANTDGISAINADANTSAAKGIFTIGGAKVKGNANATTSLPRGMYIVNGKKVLVK